MEKHAIRKKPCKPKLADASVQDILDAAKLVETETDYKCKFCSKYYSHRQSLDVHEEACELKQKEADALEAKSHLAKPGHKSATRTSQLKILQTEVERLQAIVTTTTKKKKKNYDGYIYMLITREFLALKQPVYKVGYTASSVLGRFNQYPKGSQLIYTRFVHEAKKKETLMLEALRSDKAFINRTDIGSEYFQGEMELILRKIMEVLANENACILRGVGL